MQPNFIAFYDNETERTQLLISETYLKSLPEFECVAEIEVIGEELGRSWGYDAEDGASCVEFNNKTGRRYNLHDYRRDSLYGNKLDCLKKLIAMLDDAPSIEESDEPRFTEL